MRYRIVVFFCSYQIDVLLNFVHCENEGEEYEEKRYQKRRDVWVKPGLSFSSRGESRRESELKKEVSPDKYTWVNPNRKHKEGSPLYSWPERRASIEVLHSSKDVPAALRE